MNWTHIANSSAISQVGYDPQDKRLVIQSLNGTPYEYLGVPPEAHQAFLDAPSKGRAWAEIKKAYALKDGHGVQATRPAPVKAASPVVKTTVEPPAAEVLSLAISFESNGKVPTLPFAAMVERLKLQMDQHFATMVIEIDDLAKRAMTVSVGDEASFTDAAELGKRLASKRKSITAMMKPTKQAIDSVKAVVLDKEKQLLVSAQAGEDRLSRLCSEYRTAEQRRANEAAEAERKRRLKEAEDKRIADAEAAQAQGRTRLAEALLSTPVTAPKVEVEAAVPKVQGVKAKTLYKWRLLNLNAVPREWLVLNESLIGKYARDNKLADGTVLNGIEFYSEADTDF